MSNLRLLDPMFSDNFDQAFRRFFPPGAFEREQPLQMRIDVNEKPDAYSVQADIPGVKKDDIHVQVEGNVVRIDAEVRKESETKGNGDKVLRSERYVGTLSRAFSLAQEIDEGQVQARYADGVLSLELPKKKGNGARKITVA